MSEEKTSRIHRREFVKGLSIAAVTLPAITCGASPLIRSAPETMQASSDCEWCGAGDAPVNPSARIVIPPRDEPGEPLVISGTVYKEDGRTPAAGITIYAYHTNAAGIYPKRTPDDGRPQWRHGYLRGWMRTGRDGKYEFRTIKPAAYPGRREPAHIHLTMSGANYPEYPGTFWFADDPLVTPEVRARNNAMVATRLMRPAVILTLRRDESGVLRGAHDIRIERIAG
ncbi:hypothetical protein BH18ACI2_BH18ACI2_20730 [soil metagenome]